VHVCAWVCLNGRVILFLAEASLHFDSKHGKSYFG
jgi:hypothetical protein